MAASPKPTKNAEPHRVVADRCRDGRCRTCRGCEHSCHARPAPADLKARFRAAAHRGAGTRQLGLWDER